MFKEKKLIIVKNGSVEGVLSAIKFRMN